MTDPLGKPVLMLNAAGQVAGEAEYTASGLPNRVTYISDTKHPYTAVVDSVLGFFNQPHGINETVRLRARFSVVDMPENSTDYASLTDAYANDLVDGGTHIGDAANEKLVSDWVPVPTNGLIHLRFKAATQPGYQFNGLTLEGYDYQTYQTGAAPVWIRLGLPGQYYDPETDLFENWHRFYDPSTGRYLEPEPLWRKPLDVLKFLASGNPVPVFAYAGNNPLSKSDTTGERWVPLDRMSQEWVDDLKAVQPRLYWEVENALGSVYVHADGKVPASEHTGDGFTLDKDSSVAAITVVPELLIPGLNGKMVAVPAQPDVIADITINPSAPHLLKYLKKTPAHVMEHELFHIFVIMGKIVAVRFPECKNDHACEEREAEAFANYLDHSDDWSGPNFDGRPSNALLKFVQDPWTYFYNPTIGDGDVTNRGGGSW